jgi:histidinol-phosphate aminotransferase
MRNYYISDFLRRARNHGRLPRNFVYYGVMKKDTPERTAAQYVRAEIQRLEAYVPGRQPRTRMVKLNANENPYPPSPRVLAALAAVGADAARLYPDATAQPVREVAAQVFGVAPDEVLVGNGSDDVLTMVVRAFLDAGDRIAVTDPTYTLYQTIAAMQGAQTDVYPLDDAFQLTPAFFTAQARMTFLASPNAQTGTLFDEAGIARLCAQRDGVVVIDEAYAPFAGVTCVPLLRRYANLIVLRTLSKSHSMAGLRIGFGLARPATIAALMKVKDSYNVNAVSQAAALAALQDADYTRATVARIVATRAWFAAALRERGWQVTSSSANFVLATPSRGTAREIMAQLEQAGYLVRHFATPRLQAALRFSIGTDEQMRGLVTALDGAQTAAAPRSSPAGTEVC